MEYKNHQGHTPMKALIQHCPEAAGIVMGRCIASSYASTDPEHTVSYDFHLLDPGPDDETALKGERCMLVHLQFVVHFRFFLLYMWGTIAAF